MVAARKTAPKRRPPRRGRGSESVDRPRPDAVFRGGISYMTSKGQVTITANLRKALGLKPGDQVMMMLQDDGTVRLERIKDLAEVIDSFPRPPAPPIATREMDEIAQAELARQAMKHGPGRQT